MTSLLVIGFISILGQVVLLREISVAFFGIELIYALAIAAWLLWCALGASLGRRSLIPSHTVMGALFVVFGLLLPVEVAWIRSLRVLLAPAPGAYLPFPLQILSMALSLLPASLLSGLLFQWAAKRSIRTDTTLARAYAIECVGALAGGVASVACFRYGAPNLTVAILCAALSSATPIAILPRRSGRLLRAGAALVTALLLFALSNTRSLDLWMTRWNHPNLLDTRDSPYSRITLTLLENQISVFENDTLSFETEGTAAEEFVHLAALQSANPSQVLILGGGVEGIVAEILRYGSQRIDYIELNPVLLEMFRRYFPASARQFLSEKPVNVSVTDPRQFLAATGVHYDLILLGMPEPSSGQSNRFYTKEFFALCAAHLNPGGVFALRLRAAENLWTQQMKFRMVSIYQALRSAFADVLFLPGPTSIVLASQDQLIRDPALLAERFRARNIKARLVSPAYIQYQFRNDRFAKIAGILGKEMAQQNTDSMPVCYQHSALIWLSKFIPAVGFIDVSVIVERQVLSGPILWIGGFLLLAVCVLLRLSIALRLATLVACAAFSGMVLEIVLILHYQVKCGVLYQNIGVLLTAFMFGLATGSWSLDIPCGKADAPVRAIGLSLAGSSALISASLAWAIRADWLAGLTGCSIWLGLVGFLVAGVFAYAASQEKQDQRKAVAPLYSSDLLGGCLGSLIATLILIPFIGLPASAAAMVPLALFSALLL